MISLRPLLLVPTERPPSRHIYSILEGYAEDATHFTTLAAGESWGAEETLLPRSPLIKVRCLSFVHVCFIDAVALRQMVDEEPELAPACEPRARPKIACKRARREYTANSQRIQTCALRIHGEYRRIHSD